MCQDYFQYVYLPPTLELLKLQQLVTNEPILILEFELGHTVIAKKNGYKLLPLDPERG
jgi:hypothetical protein